MGMILFVSFIAFITGDYFLRCGNGCKKCKNLANLYFDLSSWQAECVECADKAYFFTSNKRSCVKNCEKNEAPIPLKKGDSNQ